MTKKKPLDACCKNPAKNGKHDQPCCLGDFIVKMPGCVFVKDHKGTYIAANNSFLELAGLNSLNELIGKTDHDLPWKNRREEYRKNDEYVIETDEVFNCEETITTAAGEIKTFLTAKSTLKDEKGNIVGLIGNAIDITENKKHEVIRKNLEISEKTIQFMEMLAGNIAYELRTPLSIIKLNIDLLEHSYHSEQIGKKEKEIILIKTLELIKHVIQSNTSALENILVTLRNLVRGQIDTSDFFRSSMNDSIDDTITHYPFQGHERSLIKWRKTKTMKDFEYIGEDLLTRHVLFNLIKNSLRAIKEAGKGKVTIELRRGKPFNQLIFRDTALGIAPDYMGKIFERFESRGALGHGSGLGLSFCKVIMQAYGGDIICQSKEGKFAEFILTFPALD